MTVPMNTPAPEPAAEPSRLRTAGEVAEHYGICRASVYNLLHRGMPSMTIGRSRRFRLVEVDAWLAEADTRKAAS